MPSGLACSSYGLAAHSGPRSPISWKEGEPEPIPTSWLFYTYLGRLGRRTGRYWRLHPPNFPTLAAQEALRREWHAQHVALRGWNSCQPDPYGPLPMMHMVTTVDCLRKKLGH